MMKRNSRHCEQKLQQTKRNKLPHPETPVDFQENYSPTIIALCVRYASSKWELHYLSLSILKRYGAAHFSTQLNPELPVWINGNGYRRRPHFYMHRFDVFGLNHLCAIIANKETEFILSQHWCVWLEVQSFTVCLREANIWILFSLYIMVWKFVTMLFRFIIVVHTSRSTANITDFHYGFRIIRKNP